MKRSTEQILTTHTGSLPRPAALVELLRRRDRGEPADPALAQHVQAAVADLVRSQTLAGLDVVNDGEASKMGYVTYVKERLEGFAGVGADGGSPADLAEFPQYSPRVTSAFDLDIPACMGPISYRDLGAVRSDIANLRAALANTSAADAFLTAASPGVIAITLENRHYPSHEEYVAALADALKWEYDEIHRAGLVLQLDCPDLAMMRHVNGVMTMAEFRRLASVHIEAINHATRDIPSDAMRMHLCWGNYEGPHHHDVPLGEVLDLVFAARPAGISFEAANPRHAHEWALFAELDLPDGRVIIPGVIDSTTNYIEHPELVAQRLVRFAELVGRENVIAGTDCGFATFANYVLVDPGIAWAKLGAMAEGAALASARLW